MDENRQIIERAALTLFTRRGFNGTNIRDIADAAGVSTGAIYNYYPSKAALFTTVDLMTCDHLPAGIVFDAYTPILFEAEAPTPEMGQSFALGFAVRTHAGINPLPGSVGDYYWAGALGTYFWIDPAKELIAIFMSQAHELRLHYRYLMRQLVYQALSE